MSTCTHKFELITKCYQHPKIRCKICGRNYELKNRFRLKPALIAIPIFALAFLLTSTVLRDNNLPAALEYGAAAFLSVFLCNCLCCSIYAKKLLADPDTYGDSMSSDL